MENDVNVFEGLQDLGFNDVSDLNLYKKHEEKLENVEELTDKLQEKEESLLYDKKLECPVCNRTAYVRAVKTNGYRLRKKDSDFYSHFDMINPYFYDVWLCNKCGYAAMKSDFFKIRKDQIPLVLSRITPKWKGKSYPKLYDISTAIERYKLALLNYTIIDAKPSKKAMNCLKLSWMYRELGDERNESIFRDQALVGFLDAYENEDTPLYGMDTYTLLYLIGDLYKRKGDFECALNYFTKIITATGAERKIKDLARNRRDDIKEEIEQREPFEKTDIEEQQSTDNINIDNVGEKTGIFIKLFKRK